jgi:hypothetical protein
MLLAEVGRHLGADRSTCDGCDVDEVQEKPELHPSFQQNWLIASTRSSCFCCAAHPLVAACLQRWQDWLHVV